MLNVLHFLVSLELKLIHHLQLQVHVVAVEVPSVDSIRIDFR